jgi:hypothetical protein
MSGQKPIQWATETTIVHRVTVSNLPRVSYVVDAYYGRTRFLRRLQISFVGMHWEARNGEWGDPRVTLLGGGGLNDPMVSLKDVPHPPAWLLDMIAEARKTLPEVGK